MREFTFGVELINHQNGNAVLDEEKDAKKVAKWFKDQNSWRVSNDDDLVSLSFEPVKSGRVYKMRCTFKMNEAEPTNREVSTIKEMIMDPDDDGNHPITLDGKQYLVMGFKD